MALSACAAVLFTVRSSGMRPNGALWAVLCGATAVALAGIVIAAVAAERAARSVHDRVGVLRRGTARREADLHALVEALRNGEPPPPRGRRTERGGDGDEFDQLAADIARAHDGAVTAVVQAAQLSSQAGSEQKLEVFVNLARRLQSLVHREISILDELENEMEDPDLLKGLFHVDHLATRIRRHAENLAVLGGAVSRRQWSNPVPMTEVLRSAIAEVEQYSRVKLVPPIDGTLRGHAVADVIHLLAELVENATVFSAPHTQVLLRANLVTSGLAVEVEDRGLGMPVGEQDRMNALLADPDQVHVASLLADGRIGLFVVSQLARRHGIHVRLQTNIYGGVQAVLVVPQSLLGGEPAAVTGAPGATAPLPPADGGTGPTGRHTPALSGPVDTRGDAQSHAPANTAADAHAEENTTPASPRVSTDFTGAGRAQLVVTGGENCEGTTGGCQHTAVYTWGDSGLQEVWLPDPGGDVSGTNEAPTVSTAAGDVDGDGYADLVTGHVPASATTTGEYSDAAGFVHVRYGSADGLGAHRTATLDAPGGGRAGDNVGASVAVGDVTGDGYDDVVAGAPGATVRGVPGTGAAVLLRGSATGLTETDAQVVHQATDGVPGTAEADDWFGSAVDLTDLDGDGRADVTIAAKGEDVLAGSVRDGADWVLRGSAAGLTTAGATSFSARDVGLTAPDAEFGSVLGG